MIFEKYNYRLRKPYLTIGLILAFALVHFFQLDHYFYFFPNHFWTTGLLLNSFAHISFIHIVGNSVFLFIYGDNVEDALGHMLFLATFIFLAIPGNLIYALFHFNSTIPLIGSSGAVSGILGIYTVFFPRVKTTFFFLSEFNYQSYWIDGFSAKSMFILWFLYQLLLFFLLEKSGYSKIAFSAHAGGFIGGYILAKLFVKLGILERHFTRLRDALGKIKVVLCPSCNTPQKIPAYGRYVCPSCQTEFYFDRKGMKYLF